MIGAAINLAEGGRLRALWRRGEGAGKNQETRQVKRVGAVSDQVGDAGKHDGKENTLTNGTRRPKNAEQSGGTEP